MLAKEGALPLLRLEQHELPLRQGERERDPGRAAAGADVHDRPRLAPHELEPAQRIVQQHAPRLVEVADRGQPGRRDDSLEPALRRG